jgi:phosphate transport system substrate-binding protein
VTGNIITAGSSTVYPLSEAMVDLFEIGRLQRPHHVDSIGTGAGFERFCKSGETDIANAIRPIKDSERENCRAIGREPIEFRVGTDALAVVVNPQNDFLTDVTLAELALIFSTRPPTGQMSTPTGPTSRSSATPPAPTAAPTTSSSKSVMQPAYEKDAKKAMEAFQKRQPCSSRKMTTCWFRA